MVTKSHEAPSMVVLTSGLPLSLLDSVVAVMVFMGILLGVLIVKIVE